jgi:dethiobiotin synthetase
VIIAVAGTGTGVGKTHIACALVGGLRDAKKNAVGWKPVESGVTADSKNTDESLLSEISGGAPAPTLRLEAPVAPNVAARRQGVTIDSHAIKNTLAEINKQHDVVVLELAGGLFSPFDDTLDNAEWLARCNLAPRLILVGWDRLGILHEVSSTIRASRALGLAIGGLVLAPPEKPDEATGSNAVQIRSRPQLRAMRVVEVPRAPVAELRKHVELLTLAE